MSKEDSATWLVSPAAVSRAAAVQPDPALVRIRFFAGDYIQAIHGQDRQDSLIGVVASSQAIAMAAVYDDIGLALWRICPGYPSRRNQRPRCWQRQA